MGRNKMKLLRRVFVVLASFIVATSFAQSQLRMEVAPTFTGATPDSSIVTVTLENDGPSAVGAIEIREDESRVLYPVDLPQGARKRILTFPVANYGELNFSLRTNQGTVRKTLPVTFSRGTGGGAVLLISDLPDSLGFVRQSPSGLPSASATDLYVIPEAAPDRPKAYQKLVSIFLGPGSERMPDGAVSAIQDYVLQGGTVAVFGGASSPVLADPRWQKLLPGTNWSPKTLLRGIQIPAKGRLSPAPITVVVPEVLKPEAVVKRDREAILEATRPYGLGKVVVLGYSPIDSPVKEWVGRQGALAAFTLSAYQQQATQFLRSYARGEGALYGRSFMAGEPTNGSGAGQDSTSEDPFQTKLPPSSAVFSLLGIYFVLVVPVSFLVLRRMKRGELAWITAPLLAIVFAGALLKYSESLYRISLSRATYGLIIAQEGSTSAVFQGTTQMFFPSGGVHDLKLSQIDSVSGSSAQSDVYYRSMGDGFVGFNLVDNGQILAPRLESNNLGFREFSYVQRFGETEWFRFNPDGADGMIIQNVSPYKFFGAFVEGGFMDQALVLGPGESRRVVLRNDLTASEKAAQVDLPPGVPAMPNVPATLANVGNTDPRFFTIRRNQYAVFGRLEGLPAGPQLGREVKSRSGTMILAFAEERRP